MKSVAVIVAGVVLGVAGCSSSSGPGSVAGDEKAVQATQSAVVALDTQGKIFCTLIDKIETGISNPGSDTPLNRLGDQFKASTAGLQTANPSIHTYVLGQVKAGKDIALAQGDTLVPVMAKARAICESQGWVGNP